MKSVNKRAQVRKFFRELKRLYGHTFYGRCDHRERRPGEIMLTNANTYNFINHVGWDKTKRMGLIAYDINGKPLKGYTLFPVFVKLSEIVEHKDFNRIRGAFLNPSTGTDGIEANVTQKKLY